MKSIVIIIAGILLIAADCRRSSDECHKKIDFQNQSNQSVHYCIRVINSQNPNLCGLKSESGVVVSGAYWADERRGCWENHLEYGHYERFVVDAEQFSPEIVPCDSLEFNYNILQYYSISLPEMKANQFIVTYP